MLARMAGLGATIAATLILAPVALSDWAPVQSAQLNTASVFAVSAASVGGAPYIAWFEGANDFSGSVFVDAVSASAASPVGGAVGHCTSFPKLGAVAGTLELACPAGTDGGVDVYTLTGSTWVQVGATISAPEPVVVSGIADDSGMPMVALLEGGNGNLIVERFSGGQWTEVGTPLIHQSGDSIVAAVLVGDGATPIVAWTEDSGSQHASVYADQLQSGTWTALNGGAGLEPVPASGIDLDLGSGALIGGAPYLALDEQPVGSGFTYTGYVLGLTGSTFTPVGGPVVNQDATAPQIMLGSDNGGPLALLQSDTAAGDDQLTADTLVNGAWSQLGASLGVPPLPGIDGDPYPGEALAGDGSGIPYVGIIQQVGETFDENHLFVENETAGGVNPNAPFTGLTTPPTVTTTTGSAVVPSPAAVLESDAAASLERHGKRVTLNTGLLATCPKAAASAACSATVTVHLKITAAARRGRKAHPITLVVTVKTRVAAGRPRLITVTLPKTTAAKLGGRVTGTETITVRGPNAERASLSQKLSVRLGAAHRAKRKKS
jgi:hypothetical protein